MKLKLHIDEQMYNHFYFFEFYMDADLIMVAEVVDRRLIIYKYQTDEYIRNATVKDYRR